jgi:hypothetical protein
MLLWTLIRHRKQDSYRDNYFFLLILPAFLVAKQLMLDPEQFRAGTAMATALFRVAFLVMLERTLTQFMKGVFQVEILRHAALDRAIKLLGLMLVVAPWMPAALAGGTALLLAPAARHPLRLLASESRPEPARHRHHVRRLSRHRAATRPGSRGCAGAAHLGRRHDHPRLRPGGDGVDHPGDAGAHRQGPHRPQGGVRCRRQGRALDHDHGIAAARGGATVRRQRLCRVARRGGPWAGCSDSASLPCA